MRLPHSPRIAHRLRILLATRPLAYWSVTIVVAIGTGAIVHRVTSDAADSRHLWGDTQPTLVAARAIAPGEPVDAADTEVRAVPIALRPEDALTAVPTGGVPAAGPMTRGEIVTASRVGRSGRSEVAALLPDGTRGVAVPMPDGALPLRAGDVVDVVAPAFVVPAARVLRVGDGTVVVAVGLDDAPAVARAVSEGQVTLVLAP